MEQERVESVSDAATSDGVTPGFGAVAQVKSLLFRLMLIGIKDGRFLLGTFNCMDKQGNIILQDAIECRRRTSPSPMEQRCFGMVLVPSSCHTSCHIDCSIDEQLSLLSLHQQLVLYFVGKIRAAIVTLQLLDSSTDALFGSFFA